MGIGSSNNYIYIARVDARDGTWTLCFFTVSHHHIAANHLKFHILHYGCTPSEGAMQFFDMFRKVKCPSMKGVCVCVYINSFTLPFYGHYYILFMISTKKILNRKLITIETLINDREPLYVAKPNFNLKVKLSSVYII